VELLLISIGGALGSITRYKVGNMISARYKHTFPVATFIINISGAFLLGILTGLNVQGNITLLFADGFLGAYTTFSTFMYESFSLFQKRWQNAAIYILSSLILGVLGFTSGFFLMSRLF
jgi:crcB protein